MGIKLEDLSPLAGAMTGKGAMGELTRYGALGSLAAEARRARARRKAEKAASVGDVGAVNKPMKSGGMTASKRADGCAVRGKTKGKMV